jgi:hypothetical protein
MLEKASISTKKFKHLKKASPLWGFFILYAFEEHQNTPQRRTFGMG